jgi:hypothetical protein
MKFITLASTLLTGLGLFYSVWNNDGTKALIWLSAFCGWTLATLFTFGKVKP